MFLLLVFSDNRGLWNTFLENPAVAIVTNLIKIMSPSINAQTKSKILNNTRMLCCTFGICKFIIPPRSSISQRTFMVRKVAGQMPHVHFHTIYFAWSERECVESP